MRVYRGSDGREMISVGEGRSVSRQYYEANRHLFDEQLRAKEIAASQSVAQEYATMTRSPSPPLRGGEVGTVGSPAPQLAAPKARPISAKGSRILDVYGRTDLSQGAIAERCGVAIVTVRDALADARILGDRRAIDGDKRRKLAECKPRPRPDRNGRGEEPSAKSATGQRGRRRGVGPSPEHIKTLELYAKEDISHSAIGNKVGAPAGSVGVWIADARKRRDPRVVAGDRLRGKAPR